MDRFRPNIRHVRQLEATASSPDVPRISDQVNWSPMSLASLFHSRLVSRRFAIVVLGWMSAGCGSSGATDNTGAGGASNATNPSGTGGTAASTTVAGDPWEPPTPTETTCAIEAGTEDPANSVKFLTELGCQSDFDALASEPMNTSIPGARSAKIVLDQLYDDNLYFQNSKKYTVHFDFASANLSVANGFADVGAAPSFGATQYSAPDRRFLLGAVTYYSGPKYWALEMAPYDTASAEMVEKLFRAVQANTFFGPSLVFHPTSDSVAKNTSGLSADIHTKTTDQIFAGIDYQPLRLGETYGKLHFIAEKDFANDFYGFRDIVVLEAIPNDIAVTAGIITQQFQTPLSHVNVLAMNRGTPNMGLRNAITNPKLVGLKEKWVKLTVDSEKWDVVEVTEAEADAWWEVNKPEPKTLEAPNTDVKELVDVENVTDVAGSPNMLAAIKAATKAFGAKTANYSILANIDGLPVRKAFAIPVFYYVQFMQENQLFDKITQMMQSNEWSDLATRSKRLEEFRAAIKAAPINQQFQDLLRAKLEAEYPGLSMRFRTSTNAEDLDGFPCAGCYDSHTGYPANWTSVLDAIRKTWATVWTYRTFQEREYNGLDHKSVAMGLLVHHNFPTEEANGVAVTQNIYVPSGMDPAYYINVQQGDAEVVAPDPGVLCDTFLYYFAQEGQPITWIAHSTIAEPAGQPVLTARQTYELGSALEKIHTAFSKAYGPGAGNYGWYGMDVEFKFDDEDSTDGTPHLLIKQARPYPDPAKR